MYNLTKNNTIKWNPELTYIKENIAKPIGHYLKRGFSLGWKCYIIFLSCRPQCAHARHQQPNASTSQIPWPSINRIQDLQNGTRICDCIMQKKYPEWCAESVKGHSSDAPYYAGMFDGTIEAMESRTDWESYPKIQKCAKNFFTGVNYYCRAIIDKFGELSGFDRFCAINNGNAEERKKYLQGRQHGQEFTEEFCTNMPGMSNNKIDTDCESVGKNIALLYLTNGE